MSELIITDDNYLNHVDFRDKGRGHIPRDWEQAPYGTQEEYMKPVSIKLIPRDAWPDLIRDKERTKTRLSDIFKDSGIKIKDQQQTNYCHANSPASAIEILRAVQGQPYVELSPGSIGGPVTGFTNRGAWIGNNLKHITIKGAASTDFVPLNQISRSGWKPGAEENALLHIVDEWVEVPRQLAFDYVMTLVLSDFPVCTAHNWWSHAVTALDGVMDKSGKKFGTRDINSWGTDYGDNGFFILMEGKGTPDEAYAPMSTRISTV